MYIVLIGLIGIIAGIWVLTLDFTPFLKNLLGIFLIIVGIVLVGMKLFQSFLEGRSSSGS